MQKFRVEFYKFDVKSITPTYEEIAYDDTFLEKHEGDFIWAIICAENREQALEKAKKFSNNLKSGVEA